MALSGVVLVLRALGLGDLLTAVPALRALRRAHPGAHLVLAAPQQLAELVWQIEAVDELWPTEGLGSLHWPGPRPRLAVNLHGRGPESISDLLATDPHELITHRHRDHDEVPGPPWEPDQHEVVRWCRLLEHAGMPADPGRLRLPPPQPSPVPGAAVVHPGAAAPARRWPPDRFAAVAHALAERGSTVVITGSAGERALGLEVAGRAGLSEAAVLAGRTGLGELAALIADASLVVCGDTGVGHLATAFGTPSVLLFGPTPPDRWGPPHSEHSRHRVLWAGRSGDPHAQRLDRGLLRITVAQVLAHVDELKGGNQPWSHRSTPGSGWSERATSA